MNTAVYYYTKSGNTKKVAEAMAKALGVTAADVSEPLQDKVDVLFLGSSLYAGGYDPAVGAFIEQNAGRIGILVNFSTSASGGSTLKRVKAQAAKMGVKVHDDAYCCPGHFLFLHKGRPNEDDLTHAAAWALETYDKLQAK